MLKEKIEKLNKVKVELKQEFIGIDSQIEQIIDKIKNWYLFSSKQKTPTVICLWGMTGVGKSDLINKLVEKLDLNHMYNTFDLGSNYNTMEDDDNFDKSLNNIIEYYDNTSAIFVFDDIHNAQTQDKASDDKRVIWQLMDTGLVQIHNHNYHIAAFDFLKLLKELIEKDIKINNKRHVTDDSYKEYYTILKRRGFYVKKSKTKSINDRRKEFLNTKFLFFLQNYYKGDELYATYSLKIRAEIKTLEDMVLILNRWIMQSFKPKTINLTQSLIFVIGNIDMLYPSYDFNKIPANIFYEITKDIEVKDIKDSLSYYFKPEEIARFGNNHIIYHSFKEEHYRSLIEKIIIDNKNNHFNFIYNYTDNFLEYLYNRTVYPSQGMRPIKKDISNIINNYLIDIYTYNYENNIKMNKFTFDINNEYVIIKENEINCKWKLKENDKTKMSDDVSYSVAVHESAHCAMSIIDTQLMPDYITINESENDGLGYTFINYPSFTDNIKLLKSQIRMSLAGYIAEEVFFGKDNVSTGVSDDIRKATSIAASIYKTGLYEIIPYATKNEQYFEYSHKNTNEQNNAIKKILGECYEKSCETIKKHKKLIEFLADVLFETKLMNSKNIKEIVKEYDSNLIDNLKDKDNYFNFKK